MENKDKILDTRKYHEYIDLGREGRQFHLMFSELIDNSIGSFDDKYSEKDWEGNVLEVNIEIYNPEHLEKKKLEYGRNGIEYYEGSYIKVSDNAFGIKTDRINTSLKLNSKNTDSNSLVHEHGRGLKQSSFYFGLGVEVKTKNNEVTKMITNLPMKEGLNKDVSFMGVDCEKEELGTEVKIYPLRVKRRISKNKLEIIIKALSERYGLLIKEGKLIINIKHCIDKKKEFSEVDQSEFVKIDAVATVKEDINHSLEERIKKWNEAEKNFKNEIIETDENINYSDLEELTKDVISKLKEIFLTENTEMKIQWKNDIIISENLKREATFWSNSRSKMTELGIASYQTYRGISIYQGHRAILHPPNGKESSNYTSYLSDSKISGNADYKFAGSINIAGTNIETSADKSSIEFYDPYDEEFFEMQIKVVYNVFSHFYESMKTNASMEGGEDLEKSDYEKAASNLMKRFSKSDGTITETKIIYKEDEKNAPIGIEYTLNKNFKHIKEKYTVNLTVNPKVISQNDGVLRTYFTYHEFGDNHHLVEATLFTGHPIWKRFDRKKNFFSEVIIVLTNILVLQEVIGRNKVRKVVDENPEIVNNEFYKMMKFDDYEIVSTINLLNDAGDDIE